MLLAVNTSKYPGSLLAGAHMFISLAALEQSWPSEEKIS